MPMKFETVEVTTDINSNELYTEPASMHMPIWTYKK